MYSHKRSEETNLKFMCILDQASRQHIQNRVQIHILESLHIEHLITGRKETSNENAKQTSQAKDPGIPSLGSSSLVLLCEFL